VDRAFRLLTTFGFIFIFALPGFGQTTIYGGRGLLRVYTAEPIGRGQLFVNSYFQTFLDKRANALSSSRNGSLGKDHTFSLGFTLGLSKRAELTLNPVLYQDDQKHIWGPPGDMRLGLKYATPLVFGGLSTGLGVFVNLPIAKNHNVIYEPYSSGKLGGGVIGLVTLDMTDAFPLVPLKLYLNFGYFDHSFGDQLFNDEEDQYLVGAGLKFPIRSIVFYTEYTGEVFVDNPAVSRSENSTRISQGVKILGPWNIIFDLAGDWGLHKSAAIPANPAYQKDYADWKVILGLNYQVIWHGAERRPSAAARLREDKRAMEELDRIRLEREGADKKLKNMQDSLDEKKPQDEKPPEEKPQDEKP
jgi:hypothetical protein